MFITGECKIMRAFSSNQNLNDAESLNRERYPELNIQSFSFFICGITCSDHLSTIITGACIKLTKTPMIFDTPLSKASKGSTLSGRSNLGRCTQYTTYLQSSEFRVLASKSLLVYL